MSTTAILRGGFGGIAAANTLRRLVPKEHAIVVVDRTPRFYVGAGKTWIMLGERTFEQVSQARAALLEEGVRFVQADGSFFELPNPVMRKLPPDEAQMRDKLDWVARQLKPRR